MSHSDTDRPGKQGLLKTFFSAVLALVCPVAISRSNAGRVPDMPSPEGLVLVRSADSAPEADLLRQVLVEAGFHPEYVPTALRGSAASGGYDSPYIYVPEAEAREARRFLVEYLRED